MGDAADDLNMEWASRRTYTINHTTSKRLGGVSDLALEEQERREGMQPVRGTVNVCDECGKTFAEPTGIDFAYSTEIHADGTKTILTEPRIVSPCCEAEFSSEEVSAE